MLQTEGGTQPPPALGQYGGSRAGPPWCPSRLPCAELWRGASWPCAPPGLQTAQAGGRGGGRLNMAVLPRPEERWSDRQQSPCHGAAAPSPTSHSEQYYRHSRVGIICPEDRASTQLRQAPCLNLSNPILGLCMKPPILSEKKRKKH